MRLVRNQLASAAAGPRNGGKYLVLNPDGTTARGEFFCIALKDRFAQSALLAYAQEAEAYDPEYGREVRELAMRSGPAHPDCKLPD